MNRMIGGVHDVSYMLGVVFLSLRPPGGKKPA